MTAEELLPISGEVDIVAARQAARSISASVGFGMVDQSRITTAVSELTRNVVRYATNGCGQVTIRTLESDEGRRGIEVVVSDEGPGIADLERAMNPGYSSGRGMGMGLNGARRLMDQMDVSTGAGRPTIVTIRKWIR